MNFMVFGANKYAKDNFFRQNQVPSDIHPSLISSWQRSLKNNLDPFTNMAAPTVSWEAKDDIEFCLQTVAKPYFNYYKELLTMSEQAIGIANSEGVILHVDSQNRKVKNKMNLHNLLTYSLWNEESVGTNSFSIALAEKTNVFLEGNAFFSYSLHPYSSAVSPIFHPQTKDIIGVLFLVGYCKKLPLQSMGWLSATSQLIEAGLSKYVLGKNACASDSEKESHQKMYVSTGAKTSTLRVIGKAPAFLGALKLAEKAAKTDLNVLLTGETGTGKEVFSRTVHNNSSRAGGPFIAVNCGAIPRELIASELFGYAEGAFTGASRQGYPGRIEQANGGTLFLDEIGDAPYEVQVGLLRALEEGFVNRLGSVRPKPVNVRVLAATSRNLDALIQDGTFRKDLYYRLSGININIPPLRERKEDIPLLVDYYLDSVRKKTGRQFVFSADLIHLLLKQDWPGNIRELKNTVERLTGLTDDEVIDRELFLQLIPCKNTRKINLIETLREANGNVSRVAQKLGKSRLTIYRWMKEYGIKAERLKV